MNSKLISISAISAGLVALFLVVGAYFEMADLFSVVFASVFVMLPLYYRSYKASILSYLVGGVIAFLISGFNLLSLVFPAYFAFFGIYPIIKCFIMEKRKNKYVGFVLCLIWFVAVAIGLYFYYTSFMGMAIEDMPAWFNDYALIFVALLAVLVFVVFDRFVIAVRRIFNYYLKRIIK